MKLETRPCHNQAGFWLVLVPLIFAAAKLIAYKLFNSNKHNKTEVGGFGGSCNANGNDQATPAKMHNEH